MGPEKSPLVHPQLAVATCAKILSSFILKFAANFSEIYVSAVLIGYFPNGPLINTFLFAWLNQLCTLLLADIPTIRIGTTYAMLNRSPTTGLTL